MITNIRSLAPLVGLLVYGMETVSAQEIQSFGSSRGPLISNYEESSVVSNGHKLDFISHLNVRPGSGYCCCYNTEGHEVSLAYFLFLIHDGIKLGSGPIRVDLYASNLGVVAQQTFRNETSSRAISFSKGPAQDANRFLSFENSNFDVSSISVYLLDLSAKKPIFRRIVKKPAGLQKEKYSVEDLDKVFVKLYQDRSANTLEIEDIPRNPEADMRLIERIQNQFDDIGKFFRDVEDKAKLAK